MPRSALILLIVSLSAREPRAQPQWPVDAAPVARIATTADDGSPRMGGIAWAARIGPDEIAVGDGVDNTVRILAFDGSERRRHGREGRGPGEFRSIGWLSTCGADSLYVWDIREARMTVLHPRAGYSRSWTNTAVRGPMALGCSPSREFAFRVRLRRTTETRPLVNTAAPDGTRYRIYRDTFDILVVDADGRDRWEANGEYRRESVSANLPNGEFAVMTRLGAPQTHVAFLGSSLLAAQPDSAQVRRIGPDGRVAQHFTTAFRGAPPSAASDAAELRAMLRRMPPGVDELWPRMARVVPRAEHRLAFHDLHVDPRALAWLVTTPPGSAATRLVAHRADGSAVATMEIPAELTIFEVGEDHVLGRVEDEDGEQWVVLYRFHRR